MFEWLKTRRKRHVEHLPADAESMVRSITVNIRNSQSDNDPRVICNGFGAPFMANENSVEKRVLSMFPDENAPTQQRIIRAVLGEVNAQVIEARRQPKRRKKRRGFAHNWSDESTASFFNHGE